ncbi:IclR family transcriptional regulator [Virgibacillus natechei]
MSVKSASRVLDIIDYLSSAEEDVTLIELSKALDIPKSSMSQLLSTMVNENYLAKSQGNIYKLGHKLITAGNKARTSNDIYSASISILKDTVASTNETVFLAIRSSEEIIYLAKVDSENSTRTTAQPGMRKPLHCTGLGKTFLSFERKDIRTDLIQSITLKAYTPSTITKRKILKQAIVEYQNQGYAIDDEENDIGIYCVAAPIFRDQGEMVAAISCAGPKPRMLEKRQTIIEEITEAAKEISKTQGFSGGDELWK